MKLEYPKEWFTRKAEMAGECEVGAGIPPWRQPEKPEETPRASSSLPCPRMAFARFIELSRRQKGWNLEQLAAEAGLDPLQVLAIERDPSAKPEKDAVIKLAKTLGVPEKKLLALAGLADDPDPELRQSAIRFATRSTGNAPLEPHEREALETFVMDLGEGASR